MSIRDAFVERFGEEEAQSIERAATEHSNGINGVNRGSDPFKWALLICIGYQCMEVDGYRLHHNISTPFDVLREWIIANGELATHDGDCDYLALMAGKYNEYVMGTQECK